MAFSTGVANDWAALRTAMNTFLTGTLAWTNTYVNGVNANNGALFDAATWSLDGMYWNFDMFHANDVLQCWPSTGNDGASVNFGNHTGRARGASGSVNNDSCRMDYITYPLTYFFYGDESGVGNDDYFHMVLRPSVGFYHHMCMGYIRASWTAARPFGAFVASSFAVNNNTYTPMRNRYSLATSHDLLYYPYSASPVGAQTSILNTQGNVFANGWCGVPGWNDSHSFTGPLMNFIRAGASALTGRTVLAPNPAIVHNGDNESNMTRLIFAGDYPGIHVCSMEGLPAEAQLTVGSDTYDIYPLTTRGTDNQANPFNPSGTISGLNYTTGLLALAYRRF